MNQGTDALTGQVRTAILMLLATGPLSFEELRQRLGQLHPVLNAAAAAGMALVLQNEGRVQRLPDGRFDLVPSAAQRTAILEALVAKTPRPCPRCGTLGFSLLPYYLALPIYAGGGKASFSSVPAVGVTCAGCGYLMLHNPASLGIEGLP